MKGGKWQLTCPHCKRELVYDDDAWLSRQRQLAQELERLKQEHSKLATLKFKRREDALENGRLIAQLRGKKAAVMEEIQIIKGIRHTADRILNEERQKAFNGLVKERLGEAEYAKMWKKVDEDLKPYNPTDLMKHSYTRGTDQQIISINKI